MTRFQQSGEKHGYMSRDKQTGEEYVLFDPPGGEYRGDAVGDEYGQVEKTWRTRDRRDGVWKNGLCIAFRPEFEGVPRQFVVDARERLIRVPRLDRTMVFDDGYEVIEAGSEDGWKVWKWCEANCEGLWFWYNLDGTGPWLEVEMRDMPALFNAFPELMPGDDEAPEQA